ncbi:MAG: helix-turn-helix transcriptional regulator [Gemmatimonadales bacterium]
MDPALEGKPKAKEIERFRVFFPSLPLIVYTELTPDIPAVLLKLGQAGIRDVVVVEHDDHPERLGDLLVKAAAAGVAHRLISSIEDLLAKCPRELRWAIETIIREPAQVQTVQQLADRARMDRRTCLRWFARANLPTPGTVLTVLRVVYGHRLLQDPGYTVEDVAKKLGFSQVRTFVQHVRDVFGVTPKELRVLYSPEETIATVRERFFTRPAAQVADAS